MAASRSGDERTQQEWEEFLSKPDFLTTLRGVFSRIPSQPRCQLCAAPFGGVGKPIMQVIGKRQSTANPNMCTACERELLKRRGGAEVPSSMLFADIRGSTSLAERMTPAEFRSLLARFYTVASETVYAHGGIVDKFVGDELVAAFPPFLGERHAERAVSCATDVLRATGHADASGPWVPLGAAVHTGRVWFGAIGEGSHVEITAVGDVVNTTARLAAAAGAGEVLVSTDAATAAGLDPTLERRSLELKGKQDTTDVVTVRVAPPA
jgi:adenylate cyclase